MKVTPIQPAFSRTQSAVSAALGFIFYTIISRFENPFHTGLAYVGLISGIFHSILFIFFKRIFPIQRVPYALMSIFNHILLGFAIHYTGGILSPFIFVFFFILISDTANGSAFFSSYLACLLVYFVVVGGEYFGFLDPVFISTEEIYASRFGTVLVAGSVVLFLTIVGEAYKNIINGLRTSLQKELEEKERARQEMSKMDAASQLGLVVNKIVHDLRGPLGAIGGFINVIKRENTLTTQSEEDCDMMLQELNRITTLLNRLIIYAKPGQMQKSNLCVVDTMETVLSVISFYPGAQRIRFQKNFPADGDGIFIYAAKEEMQQVFFNILKNAIEALEKSSQRNIGCHVYKEEMNAVVEIADTGDGMPEQMMGDPWSGGVSTKKDGGGLGLRIVREILDAYNGDIKISSERGSGTRVVVRLPLAKGVS